MGVLTKMNDLVLAERNALSPDDDCYYLLEYTAQDNFPYSLGNSLITNLKKKTDRRRTLEWSYKEWTIQQIAAELATALPNIVLFDDVIASGNHFTACKRFLLQHHPATHITGIFIACVLKK